MAEFVTLTASDGHQFQAWVDGPEDARHGLVVIQEIFGVNEHMRDVCARFAKAGYRVVSPALFDRAERGVELGYDTEGMTKGRNLRAAVPDEKVMLDVEAAAAALGSISKGIVGYCWGGTIAWWGATRSKSFAAANGWYGGGIAGTRDEKPGCPVELHFGEKDAGIPMTDVELIRDAQPDATIFVYDDAPHGFGCDARASYRHDASELAWTRTLEFFGKNLG
jgi:carboxymethylenebutenolidase